MEVLDLSDFCKTKAQANDFIMRLSALSQKLYETDFNLEQELIHQFGIQKKDAFMGLLRNNNINMTSIHPIKNFIAQVLQKASSLPVLNITLAFNPTEDTLKAFSNWFILNTNKQVLFNITVDTSLIAGAAIYYNARYVDYSIKTTFERIIREVITGKKEVPIQPTAPVGQTANNNVGQQAAVTK